MNNKNTVVNEHHNVGLVGFTLTEVIISLAISAILISLVVKLFTFFSETQKINNEKLSGYEAIINTEQLLSMLMVKSDSVHYINNELLFYFVDGHEKSLSFVDSFMIYIDTEYSDTIRVSTGERKIWFYPSTSLLLQSISFPVLYFNQIIPFKFFKDYEGKVIVNSQMIKHED